MSSLGNKKVMAENIRRYMESKGIDRKEFCQRLGFKYSTVTDWLNAEKYPRIDKIEMIANFFNISKADLVEPYEPTPAHFPDTVTCSYRVPILGRVAAGVPIYADEDLQGYEYIDNSYQGDGYEYFALRIQGHSMEPRIWEGDIVIVRRQDTVDSGETAVVLIDGEDATVKMVKEAEGGIFLIGHNVAVYQPHFYSTQDITTLPVKILGKVIEVRGKIA